MRRYPAGHCTLLSALALTMAHPEQIILRGPREDLAPWLAAARSGYRPARTTYAIPWESGGRLPAYLPKLVSTELRASVVAYRCRGMSCDAPITDLEAFRSALD